MTICSKYRLLIFKLLLVWGVFSLFNSVAFSQQIFNNPNFEGPTGNALAPPQWNVCSGTPDVLPAFAPISPSSGLSCVGLIINNPGIFEKIGQQLPFSLDSTKCYSFDIDLKNGSGYGPSFSAPGRLAIWFGDSACKKQFLAYTSPIITHTPYRTYTVSFQPNSNYTHTLFEIVSINNPQTNCSVVLDNITNETITSSAVELGNDTLLCFRDSILLDASSPNLIYQWSDNSTDSVLMVKTPGLYLVTVTDLNGCQGFDQILVSYPDTLNLGNDTSICASDSFILRADVRNSTFRWQDNSTDSFFVAKTAGMYHVTVTTANCVQIDSINLNLFAPINLNLGVDTTLCNNDTLILDATATGATYEWQDLSTSPQFIVRSPGTYFVKVSQNNCDYFDTILVNYSNPPQPLLGADTGICRGDSIILRFGGNNGATVEWSDASNGDSLIVKQEGLYWVKLSFGSCFLSDTINVSFINSSIFNLDLGNDTLLCLGANLLLDATTPNASYLWQDLSTQSTFLVNNAGQYHVEVSEGICIERDTINVDYVDTLNLGFDTTICSTDSILLNVPIANSSFLWQDNSTDSFIVAKDSGLYFVEVSTENCIQRDSIRINYFAKPNLNLGLDTILCNDDSLILNASVANGSYLWQDNSTNPVYVVKDSGTYSVEVIQNGCSYSDTIRVDYIRIDSISLGNDTTLCLGDSLILTINPAVGSTVEWNDGSSINSLVAKQSGTYWVKISQGSCSQTDTIKVNFLNISRPIVSLGEDTSLCPSDSIALNASWPNGKYLWQDSSTNSSFLVKNEGLYFVRVSDSICFSSDSIIVDYIDEPNLSFPSEFFCEDRGLLLNFTTPNATYIWQDSSTNPTFLVQDTGFYWVEVWVNQCLFLSDTVFINSRDCICDIRMPNIFTPNGDSNNDEFFLETECDLKKFHLSFYNRYGQVVFESYHINLRWDGRKDGKPLSEGVYFYVLEYETTKGDKFQKKGSVQLIR